MEEWQLVLMTPCECFGRFMARWSRIGETIVADSLDEAEKIAEARGYTKDLEPWQYQWMKMGESSDIGAEWVFYSDVPF